MGRRVSSCAYSPHQGRAKAPIYSYNLLMSDAQSIEAWARLLATNWEARAKLPSRDLFVASHPGWNNPKEWERHARIEAELFVSGLDEDWLASADLLEIGCGSGRLVSILRSQVCSYTGIDIAAGMVEAAKRRCDNLAGVRFFQGDGLSVPRAAQDRQYQLILSIAVLIHCPRKVIAANLASAWSVLAPGGQLRIQVLGDPEDKDGIIASTAQTDAATELIVNDMNQVIQGLSEEERALAFDTYYMGERFRYAELTPFLLEIMPEAEVVLYRADPGAIYASLTKPE